MNHELRIMQKNTKIYSKLFLLNAVLGLGFLVSARETQAATYYVDKDCNTATYLDNGAGDGSCAGGNSRVFNTIQAALNHSPLTSGDIIKVQSGTYNETLIISKPGITLQGYIDGNGNRLSIIDPYTDISGGWTLTSDGVYTKNLGYNPWALAVEIGGVRYKIPRICNTSEDTSDPIVKCGQWYSLLHRGTTKDWWDGHHSDVNMWDGFHALFHSGDDALTYLRFEDQSNVSLKKIYASTNGENTVTISASSVAIKNFEIRAKKTGIYIEDGANGVTVDNNKLILGRAKMIIRGHNAIISNNVITDRAYAEYVGEYDNGAWSGYAIGDPYYKHVRGHKFDFEKYYLTPDGPLYESGGVLVIGWNPTITGNEIFNMNAGIGIMTGSDGNFMVANNYIHNITAPGFFNMIFTGGTGYLHSNIFSDVNNMVRYNYWEGVGGVNNMLMYIYNNRFWNPPGNGESIFFHYGPGPGSVSTAGTAWIYHNSFSGGYSSIGFTSGINYVPQFSPTGLGNIRVVNNIMSPSLAPFYPSNIEGFTYNIGICSYNWIRTSISNNYRSSCPSGVGNYITTATMWNTTALHEFNIMDSNAINTGIDISQSFTINGTSYPALPGFSSNYFTGAKPNMGAVQAGDTDTTPPAAPQGVSVQ